MNTPTPTAKSSLPEWGLNLARLWNASSHSLYILHGNVADTYPLQPGGAGHYGSLKALLHQRLFPNRQMFMMYDIADGLTFATMEMQAEFFEWLSLYNRASSLTGGRTVNGAPREFRELMPVLRQFINQKTAEPVKPGVARGITLLIEYPEKIIPNTTDAGASSEERLAEVSLLKFASMNRGKDVGIFLLTESIMDLSDQVARSPYVAQIRIDMPGLEERREFLQSPAVVEYLARETTGKVWEPGALASKLAGLNLLQIHSLIAHAVENAQPISDKAIADGKKRLIEENCQGLVTFKEASPKKRLAHVANHVAAKKKLEEIAWLIRENKVEVLERGLLIPGRIGVGKSFLIDCFASECGLPVLELGNFRSKWVGDTEKQLSKVLLTIRALGPVIVVVDEADAVFGSSREGSREDSGVSSRVFAALANHIGNSELRGRELWIAMTSRPDLLAIDMKRQGRFGLCIPLFPTQNPEEVVTLFEVIAKTRGLTLGEAERAKIVELMGDKPLTGSDVEAILVRAQERAILAQRPALETEDITVAVENFIDPLDTDLLMLQELAGVLACSDRRYLPDRYANEDRAALREMFNHLKLHVG